MSVPRVLEDDLDITVARYVPLEECPGFTREEVVGHQLPTGFAFLVNRRSGQVIEPVFRFLYERERGYARYSGPSRADMRAGVRNPVRKISLSTVAAAAENLRLWFGYLAFRKKGWQEATALDIMSYWRGLGLAVSPRTWDKLTAGTIGQRLNYVLEFYRWTNAKGLTRLDSRDLGAEELGVSGRPSTPRPRAFSLEEWGRLRPVVGPLPSEPHHDPEHPQEASCRDRLMYEIAIHTGMRRHEVCGLTVHQIRALEARLPAADAGMEFAAKGVWLTVVKGGPRRARDAIFPVWLVRELLRYADGPERSRAAAAYAKVHRGREPSALFLNHAWSHHAPGEPMEPKRMTARFNEIMREAGFVERVTITDPDTGELHQVEKPSHGLHDLRHTAAVWRYMVERNGGNPDPWVPVQIMLGHKSRETTKGLYLQITNAFEAEVSDQALRFFRGIAQNSPYTQVVDP